MGKEQLLVSGPAARDHNYITGTVGVLGVSFAFTICFKPEIHQTPNHEAQESSRDSLYE
jgi:hypothetical protein